MKTLASIGLGILLTVSAVQAQPGSPSWDNRMKLQQTVEKVHVLTNMSARMCIGRASDPSFRVGPVPGARVEADAFCGRLMEDRGKVQADLWRQCKSGNFGRIVDPDGLVVCP